MRSFINIVTEARKPTKTRDKTSGFDLMPGLEKGVATTKSASPIAGRTASRSRTQAATRGMDPALARQAAGFQLPDLADEIDDTEAARRSGHGGHARPERIEPNIENLPAVIHNAMIEGGGREVAPDWHQVKHLPGYMQQPIRAMGRSIFRQFTDTPIEDIQVMTTIGNINSERDVKAMMNWLQRNGQRDDAGNIDFSRIMPGYQADVSLWNTPDYSFLIVSDFMGYYIYGWAGGRGTQLPDPTPQRRLR